MTTTASNMKKPAQQNLGCKILVIELKYKINGSKRSHLCVTIALNSKVKSKTLIFSQTVMTVKNKTIWYK